MKKKICPYCDQIMKSPGYCGHCRRLVLHPVEREVNYYLNERHPAVEENCSYHGSLHGENGEESGKDSFGQKPSAADFGRRRNASVSGQTDTSVPARQRRPEQPEAPAVLKDRKGRVLQGQIRPAPETGGGYGKGTKKKRNPIAAAVLVYMAVIAAAALINNFAGFGSRVETAFAPPVMQETEQALPDWTRTDEQVKAEGSACNAYGHLAVSLEAVLPVIREKMEEAGYSTREYYHDSLNMVQENYRSYNTYYDYDLLRGEEWKGGLELSFDTATGEMHGLRVSLNPEETEDMAAAALEAMKDLGLLSEETNSKALFAALEAAALENDMSLFEQDGLEIALDIFKGEEKTSCSLLIYGRGYLTDPAEEV